MAVRIKSCTEAIDYLLKEISGAIRLGAPLGLGKPNVFLNQLFDRLRVQPERQLELYTALSLDVPKPDGFLAERFLGIFLERHFGADYPWLKYVRERHHLPANFRVYEFFTLAGSALSDSHAQRNHISLNYTHAASGLLDRGLNAIVQIVARDSSGRLSLSCNPDVTLDLDRMARERKQRVFKIAFVHPELPFLEGQAVVKEEFFDAVVEEPESYRLFALPRRPVDETSHAIGLYASSLVADGGTLQIGIGELGDALAWSLCLRQSENSHYGEILAKLGVESESPFNAGLFGLSEMVTDSLLRLREAGILKREITTPDGHRLFLQGGFGLGSKWFYERLRKLSENERHGIAMCPISEINDLYDPDETELRRERSRARFFNTAMEVNLLGGAMSDTLDNGLVVSGVGGQYNFVAMAHELSDAKSVLMLRSTRTKKGRRFSNITFHGGHLTISRHLRDTVVTEYGVAELRARSDEECIRAMIEIADAEFQPALIKAAQRVGKLSSSYNLPERARNNTTQALKSRLAGVSLPSFPFGSDFTPEEERLALALERLQKNGPSGLVRFLARGLVNRGFESELKRMGLGRARGPTELFWKCMLRGALD